MQANNIGVLLTPFLWDSSGSKVRIKCTSRGEYCSPTFRGPHKIACGDFAGSPIRDKVLSSDIGVLFTPFLRVSPEIVPP